MTSKACRSNSWTSPTSHVCGCRWDSDRHERPERSPSNRRLRQAERTCRPRSKVNHTGRLERPEQLLKPVETERTGGLVRDAEVAMAKVIGADETIAIALEEARGCTCRTVAGHCSLTHRSSAHVLSMPHPGYGPGYPTTPLQFHYEHSPTSRVRYCPLCCTQVQGSFRPGPGGRPDASCPSVGRSNASASFQSCWTVLHPCSTNRSLRGSGAEYRTSPLSRAPSPSLRAPRSRPCR